MLWPRQEERGESRRDAPHVETCINTKGRRYGCNQTWHNSTEINNTVFDIQRHPSDLNRRLYCYCFNHHADISSYFGALAVVLAATLHLYSCALSLQQPHVADWSYRRSKIRFDCLGWNVKQAYISGRVVTSQMFSPVTFRIRSDILKCGRPQSVRAGRQRERLYLQVMTSFTLMSQQVNGPSAVSRLQHRYFTSFNHVSTVLIGQSSVERRRRGNGYL